MEAGRNYGVHKVEYNNKLYRCIDATSTMVVLFESHKVELKFSDDGNRDKFVFVI